MQENNLNSLFYTLSRAIIVFALMIFVIGLIMRFNQNKPKTQLLTSNNKLTIITPTTTSAMQLNLKGPFVCNFSSKEVTISGYIKDMNAFGQIKKGLKTTNILLRDDCVYFWEETSIVGQKFCGLKPYISMIGNNGSLMGNLLSNQSIFPVKGMDTQSIVQSCKKKEIQDENVFKVPGNISFQEKKIPRL